MATKILESVPRYQSILSNKLPSGLYLALFHGRTDPSEDMEDWGFDGPMIGPLKFVHTTYGNEIKFEFDSEDTARRCTGMADVSGWLTKTSDDLLSSDGGLSYYGDWTVFNHVQS